MYLQSLLKMLSLNITVKNNKTFVEVIKKKKQMKF